MKSVLISVQPKRCELIASGKKTIEVRKTRPNLKTPFKCYIYKTKSGKYGCDRTCQHYEHNQFYSDCFDWNCERMAGRGAVIGEFVCDRIDEYPKGKAHGNELAKAACLEAYELTEYSEHYKKALYGWHISDLKIYDKPKELGEFIKPCKHENDCCTCKRAIYEKIYDCNDYLYTRRFTGCNNKITRPPQSWCYIEE